MAPEWTDSPVTIAIMVAITLFAVGVTLYGLFLRFREEWRRTSDAPERNDPPIRRLPE